MKLTIHRDTSPEAGESFITELEKVFELGEPEVTVLPAVNPDHRIFWINLIGKPEEWAGPIKESSEYLLSRCGGESSGVSALLGETEGQSLREAAEVLWGVKASLPEYANFVVGIPLPNNHLHAGMKLEGDSVEDLALRMANFVSRIEKADGFLARAAKDGRGPQGAGYFVPNADGSITLEWMEEKSLEQREFVLA
jgi:hypothetical protein